MYLSDHPVLTCYLILLSQLSSYITILSLANCRYKHMGNLRKGPFYNVTSFVIISVVGPGLNLVCKIGSTRMQHAIRRRLAQTMDDVWPVTCQVYHPLSFVSCNHLLIKAIVALACNHHLVSAMVCCKRKINCQ